MTITIGNPNLPGVYATQESGSTVRPNTTAPADVGLVGEADLSAGSALANTVYEVTTATQASRLFGASPLGKNVADAIQNGAYPVYAVATEMTAVVDEDISGISGTSGTLANFPLTEDATGVTVNVDGSDKTVSKTYNDPAGETVAAGDAVYNPVTGEVELDASPASSATVTYDYANYTAAIDALVAAHDTLIDFIGVIVETPSVVSHLETVINTMASERNFAMGIIGAASYIADTSTYGLPVDNKRMQLAFGSRDAAGDSLIGAWVGRRGAIGIQRSGMRVRLSGKTDLYRPLTVSEKIDLQNANVLVFETDRGSVRAMNDATAVDPTSADGAAYDNGLASVVGDFITEVVIESSEPFISRLNRDSALKNLEDTIVSGIEALVTADVLVKFSVYVEAMDARNARVEIGLEFAEPIENINVVIVGGEVA